ncbi:MAG TPA: hypothetical protein VFJ19_21080 [Nocardioidaceae bacterium]|nr:hypothetical protein [Nocardioidaceae bacterium]
MDVIGPEQTDTLFGHLPPDGWGEVASKHDLDILAARTDARFDAIDSRFDAIGSRFDAVGSRFDAIDAKILAMQWMLGLLVLLVGALLGTAIFG